MTKKLAGLALLLLCASFANAGIIRHVVKPVAKATAKVAVKTAKVTAHATKAVVY